LVLLPRSRPQKRPPVKDLEIPGILRIVNILLARR
jgi:hypothetical protein